MRYRQVGRSGLTVSVLGLGCNNFGGRITELDEARAVVETAIEDGVTFFDTSDSYGNGGGSEEMLGTILRKKRDDVTLATKFSHKSAVEQAYPPRASRQYIRKAVEDSLRRLQTDYIDLYQLHSPDPLTPLEETLSALDELVKAGKVRYVGCSNFMPWELAEAACLAKSEHVTPFISVQNNYNMLEREVESELVPACLHYGVGLLPYYPLAAGLLSGKYSKKAAAPAQGRLVGKPEANDESKLEIVDQLKEWAETKGLSLLDVAIGALAAQAAVGSVIAGASSPQQVKANVSAANWQPTESDLDELNKITPSRALQAYSGALYR